MSQTAGQALIRKLARGGLSSLLVKLCAALFSFLMFIVVARGMTVAEYGLFGFGFSAATLMVLAGSMGQRLSALRFIPVYLERHDTPSVRGFTARGYRLVCLGTAVLAVGFALVSMALPGLTGGLYAVAVGLFAIALAVAEYQSHVLRGHGRVVLALAPREVVWRGAVIVFFGLPALSLTGPIPADWGFVAIAALLLVITLIQAQRHPETRFSALLATDRCVTERGQWNAAAKVFWATSVLRAAIPNFAMMAVGLYFTAETSGAYFAALRLAMVVNIVVVATRMLAMPMLSGAHERKDETAVRTISHFFVLATTVPALAFVVLFGAAGDWALRLYGPEFSSAAGVLLIIACGHFLNVLSGPVEPMLQMTGHEKVFLKMTFWIDGLLLLALLPMVWAFGIAGAALCTALELALTGWIGWFLCRRKLGFDPGIIGALGALFRGGRTG